MLLSHWLISLANRVFTSRGRGGQRRSLTRGTSLLLRSNSRDVSGGAVAAEVMEIEPLEDRTLLAVTQLGTSQTAVENSGAQFSVTFNYTVGAGTQRLLVVSTAGGGNNANATSVRFAGTNLTQGPEHANGAFTRAEIFYLPLGDSASATSGSIVVSYDRNFLFFATATAFQGVDQTSPVGSSPTINNSSLNVTSATGNMVVDAVVGGLSGPLTVGSGQTAQSTASGLNFGSQVGGVSTEAGAANVAMTWSNITGTTSHVAVSIKPAAVVVVNQAPSGADKTETTNEDTAYTFAAADFGFSDPGNSPANTLLAVKITTLPGNGTLTDNGVSVTAGQFVSVADITGGLLRFTPTADANGIPLSSFTFQVQDNGGIVGGGVDLDQSPNTITINVQSVADINNDTLTVNEDSIITANVLTGSNGATADSFENGGAQLAAVTQGSRGTVTFSGNGSITYTPSADFNGTDSFTYTVLSGGVGEIATVNVTINPVADITNDALITNEDTAITANLITGENGATADTFENAGKALTSVSPGSHGTVTFAANGSVTYTPNADFNGTDSFSYTVLSNGASESATVSVTINAVVDITSDSISTNEDQAITFNAITGTNGATPDTFESGGAAITSVNPGSHGSVGFQANGSITYTPNADFNGSDSFTYTVTSGGVTETAAVSVIINAVADITADTLTTNIGTPITANLITGTNGATADSFEDGGRTLFNVTQGAHGSVTLQANGSVTYTPNGSFVSTDSFTYTVISGGIAETATVSIVAIAPPPAVSFSTDSVSVNEMAGTILITINLSSTQLAPVIIPYTVGGTASKPSDYTMSGANQLIIPSNTSSATISINIVDVIGFEPTETIVLTLGTPTNATLGTTTTCTVTILDVDAPPTVSFNSPGGSVPENSGVVLATVNLSFASAADTTIHFTVSGTANNPGDYSIAASPLVIPAGQTSGTIQINLVDFIGFEPSETVILTLGAPTNATLGDSTVKTITILDIDPPPTVSFTSSTASVFEVSGFILVPVELSFASVVPTTIPFLAGGTANDPGDYSIPINPLVIPAGQTTGFIQINIVDFIGFEPSETVVLTLGSPTNGSLGATTTTTVTILDIDAPPTVSFSTDSLTASETSGQVEVTVDLSFSSVVETTIPFSIGGTATNGVDFATSASPLVIPAGQTSGKIQIAIGDLIGFEPTETVVLTLGTPTNATLGATTSTTLTIFDIDPQPSVSFSTDASGVSETAGTFQVTVNLSLPSSQNVTIPFSVGGTANNPSDYSIASSPLVIPAGQTSGTIQINLVDVIGFESSETIILTLGTPTNGSLGSVPSTTVTIFDFDAAPVATFNTSTQSAGEGIGIVVVTVNLSFAIGQNVTVPYTIGGSAANPADYTIAASPLIIPANQQSATFNITVVNDTNFESDETVVLTLQTPTNATLGATTVDTVTITDDDFIPVVNFSTAAQSAGEGTGTVTLTVNLSGAAFSNVSIPYSVTGGSATSGTDFTLSASPLVVQAGATTGSITLNLIDDSLIEGNETVTVTLGTPTNGTLGGTPAQTVTINDNDINHAPTFNAGQQFSLPENSAGGTNAGNVAASDNDTPAPFNTLTFSLSNNPGTLFAINPVTGQITVANGAVLDFDTNPTITLGVTVTDGAPSPLSTSQNVTINLTNVNEPPVVTAATLSVPENSAVNTPVGTVAANDPDAGQTKTFSITNGNTGGAFGIDSATGAITVAAQSALNFETTPTFTLTVQATDNASPALSGSATITVNLTDVNEAPVVTPATFSIAENSAANASVGTVAATDSESGQTKAYSITAGNTGSAFAINTTTGAITVATPSALNFETIQQFSLTVQVADNGNPVATGSATITVNVTNVNEPPVVTPAAFSIAENSAANTAVGSVVANDPDANQTKAFSITAGNTGNAFAINSTTGAITVATPSAVNFEGTQQIFNLTVQVTDNGSPTASGTAAVTITVTNVNEAPVVTVATMTIAENSAVNSAVGTVSANDPDGGQTRTFSITAGNTGGVFAINPNSGAITVAVAALDFETTPTYHLTVQATDNGSPALPGTGTITINVTNANDAPMLVENTVAPTFVFKAKTPVKPFPAIAVNDPDGNTTLASVTVTVQIPTGKKNLDIVSFNPAGLGTVSDTVVGGQRQIKITLANGVTTPQMETFLRGITFASKGASLKTTTRTFSASVTDKSGADSNVITRTVAIRKK